MGPIRLIRNKDELVGTCYFELMPGDYKGICWNEGSVFLDEEVFGLIEPVFERQVPGFAHYGFVTVLKTTWRKVISDLDELAMHLTSVRSIGEIPESIGFFNQNTEADFAEHLAVNSNALSNMIRELTAWLTDQLQKYECISVLGI